jgi:hypothetical protein
MHYNLKKLSISSTHAKNKQSILQPKVKCFIQLPFKSTNWFMNNVPQYCVHTLPGIPKKVNGIIKTFEI